MGGRYRDRQRVPGGGLSAARSALVLTLLVSAACGSPDPEVVAAQARDGVLAAWREDPARGLEALQALPTDMQQMVAVEALITSKPGGQEARWLEVCAALRAPAVREHCEHRLARRPHLWTAPPPLRGPDGSQADPHREDAAGLDACPADVSPFRCRSDQALARAQAGSAEVGTPCDVLADARLRQDCRFLAAEELARRQGVSGLEQAAALCSRTPLFGHSCAVHLVAPLASWVAERACSAGEMSVANAASQRLQEVTAVMGTPVYPGLFWNYLFTDWAEGMGSTGPCPLPAAPASLPPEALPHQRAAVALGVVARHRGEPLELSPMLVEMEAALGGLEEGALVMPDEVPHLTAGGPPPDPEPPRAGRARYLLRDGLRAASTDPRADAVICLLHAAARLAPGERGLFEAARGEADPGVRETVGKLETER